MANQVDFKILPSDQFNVYSPQTRSEKIITYFTLLSKLRGDILAVSSQDDPNDIVSAYYSNVGGTQTLHLVKADGSEVTASQPQQIISGTVNYISKFTTSNDIGNSLLYDDGTNVGIGTTSMTHRLQLGTGGVFADYFQLDTTYSNGFVTGALSWDIDNGTMDVGLSGTLKLKVGQDDVWYVKNQTGSTIAKGVAVYANGTLGASGRITVAPMIANGTIPAKYFLGITAEAISNGADGYVLSKGKLRQINTNAYNEGDVLWVSPSSAGALTNTEPTAPNLKLPVAFVVYKASNGILAIRATTGARIEDASDVNYTGALDNSFLIYNSSTGVWEDETVGIFKTIAVSGQSDIVADNYTDTLTVASGTGISLTTNASTDTLTITNSAPDQTVVLTAGTGITVSGTYPSFTITNSSPSSGGTVTSIATTAPITGGTITTTGTIGITQATTSTDGYLSSTDWNTFNNKASDAFKTIAVSGQSNIVADSATDTLTFEAGSNIIITTDAATDKITITAVGGGSGSVTSVDMSVPTGFAISGNPITTSGTLALAFASGYSLPTNASQANWNTAYNDSITAFSYNTSTGVLTLTQQDAGTLTATVTLQPFSTTNLSEGTNLYFTTSRARQSLSAGTGISYDNSTGVITNSAPDQTVVLTDGTGISVTGTYPSFTITNSDRGSSQNIFKNIAVSGQSTIVADGNDDTLTVASGTGISLTTNATSDTLTITNTLPDLTVVLTGAGTTVVTGTYPNFTITSNDQYVGTVTSIATTAPITGGTITSTGTIGITQATTSTDGYLSSTDWNTFNAKEPALTKGNLTETTSSVLTITGGTGAVIGSGTTIAVAQATTSTSGYLSSTDWNTFNGKQNAITLTTTGSSGAATLVGSTLNIPEYSAALTGYLPLSGGTMTGNINWGQTDRGLTWSFNTDGAYIKFYNTGDGDTNSRLEFATTDNNDEYFRWVHVPSGGSLYEAMKLLPISSGNSELIVSGKIIKSGGTTSQFLKANGDVDSTAYYPASNPSGYTTNVGTVTSVDITAGTGIAVSGGPITSSGAITVTNNDRGSSQNIFKNIAVAGQSTIVADSNDDTLTVASGTGISLATNDTSDTLTITNTAPDQTVVLNDGTGISTSGTYPNFTITNTLPDQTVVLTGAGTTVVTGTYPSFTITSNDQYVGTVTSVATTAPITGGTITSTGTIGITQSGTASDGYLSSTDWNTFNAKIGGSGTTNYVAKFTGGSAIGNSSIFDNGNVGIGTTSPSVLLDVYNSSGWGAVDIDGTSGGEIRLQKNGTTYGNLYASDNSSTAFVINAVQVNDLILQTNSSERLRITSAGNVGIGTTSPAQKLHVYQASANSQAYLLVENNRARNAAVYTKTTVGGFYAGTSIGTDTLCYQIYDDTSGERMRIASTGATRLNAYGSGSFTGTVAYNLAVDSSGNIIETAGGVVDGSGTANYVSKWSDANTLTDSQLFDNGTNVGIGTTSPDSYYSSKLVVYAGAENGITIANSGTSGSQYLMFADGTTGNEKFRGFVEYAHTGDFMAFATSGTEKVRITSDGSLLVGTTSQTYNNSTYGYIASFKGAVTTQSYISVSLSNQASTSEGMLFGLTSTTGDIYVLDNKPLVLYTNSTEKMRITAGGSVGIGTTNPTSKLQVNGQFRQLYSRAFISNPLDTDGYAGHIIVNSNNANGDLAGIGLYTNSSYNAAAGLFALQESSTAASMVFYAGSNLATERMRITSAGNVGIGTSSPTATLDARIAGTTSGAVIKVGNVGSGDFGGLAVSDGGTYPVQLYGSSLAFLTGNSAYASATEKVRITAAGNVGIGTTAPSAKLEVYAGSNSTANTILWGQTIRNEGNAATTGYGAGLKLKNSSDSVPNELYKWAGVASVAGSNYSDRTDLAFYTNAGVIAEATEKVRITGDGNLGIGTIAPGAPLSVAGVGGSTKGTNGYIVNIGGTDGNVDPVRYMIGFTHGNTYTAANVRAAVGMMVTTGGAGNLVFETGTSGAGQLERMRINGSGDVGINNSNPSYKLDVTGDVRITSGSLGVGVVPNATDGRIDASNDIVAYQTSDRRLKENITPIANALDKVKSLTGVEFDWKEETKHVHGYEGHDTGIIAQEVQAVMPTAVRTNDSGYLSVRYEKLIGLLVEANKELAARVEELESKLK